ncbi:hypothetical protein DFH27DRAFT_610399 [Peziza echinospora]|nr:hypothetical protein DFH27DRAFT_610399 [Peziza echinospora]
MVSVKARRMALAAAVAAITATGAYAGAVWKTDSEQKQAIRRVKEESVEEKLERLENYRARLITKKTDLEVKIAGQEEKKRFRAAE